MSRRGRSLWIGAAAVMVLVVLPFVGGEPVPWRSVAGGSADDPGWVIFWSIRVPRIVAAFVGGVGLALGGAAFQALFRNPLATPYTLGVASGASLGVAVAARAGLAAGAVAGVAVDSVAALVGAAVAMMVVWAVSRLRRRLSTTVLLLAGVALNFFFSSAILFVQYTATLGDSFRIVRWLMGGLGGADLAAAARMAPFVLLGGAVILWYARTLDLLAIGPDVAGSRGVDVAAASRDLYLATSVAVAGVVAVCGPIGFVGMMAPHVCRLALGPSHRRLLPASALLGGVFLAACDTVARTVMAPVELPVGVVTAFVGGPFFLWLLLRRA